MKKKVPAISIRSYLKWPLLFVLLALIFGVFMAAAVPQARGYVLAFVLILAVPALWLYLFSRRGLLQSLADFSEDYQASSDFFAENLPLPLLLCDSKGYILWSNGSFRTLMEEEKQFSSNLQAVFPDVDMEKLNGLERSARTAVVHSSLGDRRYRLTLRSVPEREGIRAALPKDSDRVFEVMAADETELVRYRQAYEDGRACQGLIYLDNYDEAFESVDEVRRSLLTALLDRKISNYLGSMNGLVKKLEKDKYFFFVMEKDMGVMLEDRFSVLEDAKTVNIGNAQSLTLSIGVGMGSGSYRSDYDAARAAIELALGRGGDQAVVKTPDGIQYFGGKSKAVEKSTHIKARVKAEAFKDLLDSKSRLLIMGHSNGDIDCLGASMGLWRVAQHLGKAASIVCGSYNDSVTPMRQRIEESGIYPPDIFVTGDRALELLDDQTVLAVVDVNRPSFTEEPRLLERASAVALFDHHRKGSETVTGAVLSYVEPFASSASEMITELIQFTGDDIRMNAIEADALYSGIVMDTQNFINQTGVRTFEAAAYLRRCGADVTRVRKMFRDDLEEHRYKAETIDRAQIYREHIAISVCEAENSQSPMVIGAKAANSLLEVKGIKAAVVLTPFNGKVYLSARSIDEVNVQIMMEKMGGGGHKSMAGAQLEDIDTEEAIRQVKAVIDDMYEKGDIT